MIASNKKAEVCSSAAPASLVVVFLLSPMDPPLLLEGLSGNKSWLMKWALHDVFFGSVAYDDLVLFSIEKAANFVKRSTEATPHLKSEELPLFLSRLAP